jgi:mono/diheme cytochrome c family protein
VIHLVRPFLTTFVLLLIGCFCAPQVFADEEGEILFVRRILPLFQAKCLSCHGDNPSDIEGELSLLSREALLRGGASGEALVSDSQSSLSPLLLAIRREDATWSAMPPKEAEKLTDQQIQWVEDWIVHGAPWPDQDRISAIRAIHEAKWWGEDGIKVATSGGLSAEWSNRSYDPEGLWAYKPLPKPKADMATSATIDAWIHSKMPAGLEVAPPCDASMFIRRATYDLTGLPPTSSALTAFAESYATNADLAVESLVDSLLASPHYGERMAQHWLDVVRYADSAGFSNDYERGNAWRYRDYVVNAFNNDLPYDQFIVQQIAGDELEQATPESLIATGFLRMGPWELTGMEVAKVARQRYLDDITNSIGECFLAHSLQCARCHDHKFDPVPTKDYYSIQAALATTQLAERPVPFLPRENQNGFTEQKYLRLKLVEYQETLSRLDDVLLHNAEKWYQANGQDIAPWHKAVKQVEQVALGKPSKAVKDIFGQARNVLSRAGVAEDEYPPKLVGFTPEQFGLERVARKGIERLQWELDRYEPFTHSVYSGPTPQLRAVTAPLRMPTEFAKDSEVEQTAILIGGDPFGLGATVQPGVLSVVGLLGAETPTSNVSGRRLALARWIAHPQNPLTARVMVNRLWMWHFGIPLAGNPNNFGSTGKRPTHPELLDDLAVALIDREWSIKKMHRMIMLSQAYRRSCEHPAPQEVQRLDPLQTSYAVFQPRRLTAEELRDSMLLSSGELNPERGGIPCRPEINLEAALQPRQVMGTFAAAWTPNPLPSQRHRRSLYVLKLRGLMDPLLEVFNTPPLDFACERRDVSTVTPQVFALFNGESSYKRALALAHRAIRQQREAGNDDPKVRREYAIVRYCYESVWGRAVTEDEVGAGVEHWRKMRKHVESNNLQFSYPPLVVDREAVEENTGEKFVFTEKLYASADFVADLMPRDCDSETRALAELCLVLFNSNEFIYVY